MFEIANHRVVVTGSTRGIGKGIGLGFARNGAKVAFVGRHAEEGTEIVNLLQQEGIISYFIQGDISQREDCEKIASIASNLLGGIDVLVANAGIFPTSELQDITDHHYQTVMDTNFKGCYMSVQACTSHLFESKNGRIILISSITGTITGMRGFSIYAASKSAMIGFMKSIAIELAPRGVTVNAVLPGNIITEGLQGLGDDYLRSMTASIPVGRLGTVDDIANAVMFLASPRSGFITGQTIVVDGGQVLPEANL